MPVQQKLAGGSHLLPTAVDPAEQHWPLTSSRQPAGAPCPSWSLSMTQLSIYRRGQSLGAPRSHKGYGSCSLTLRIIHTPPQYWPVRERSPSLLCSSSLGALQGQGLSLGHFYLNVLSSYSAVVLNCTCDLIILCFTAGDKVAVGTSSIQATPAWTGAPNLSTCNYSPDLLRECASLQSSGWPRKCRWENQHKEQFTAGPDARGCHTRAQRTSSASKAPSSMGTFIVE